MPRKPAQILTIAGADSSGGAGIAADLKAIHAMGAYGLIAITAVTAQNTRAVVASQILPAALLRDQITAVAADFSIAAVKTGMLATAELVEVVADQLDRRSLGPLIVDPVLRSSSGAPLLDTGGLAMLKTQLLPKARLCTPNRAEAEILSGREIRDAADAADAARAIRALGPAAVLIKGGHFDSPDAEDLLLDGDAIHRFESARVPGPSPHGTGCVLSAAIAAALGQGLALAEAIDRAKRLVTAAIAGALSLGSGGTIANPSAGEEESCAE